MCPPSFSVIHVFCATASSTLYSYGQFINQGDSHLTIVNAVHRTSIQPIVLIMLYRTSQTPLCKTSPLYTVYQSFIHSASHLFLRSSQAVNQPSILQLSIVPDRFLKYQLSVQNTNNCL